MVDVLVCWFQILPQLLFYFGVSNDVDSLDWATMVVYTCESSCEANVSYKEEFVWVQHSLSSVPWWLSIYLVEEKMFLLGGKFCLNENFVWLFKCKEWNEKFYVAWGKYFIFFSGRVLSFSNDHFNKVRMSIKKKMQINTDLNILRGKKI